MRRKARIDILGALHHIICRGIDSEPWRMVIGWALGKLRIHLKGDERILGDSDFVHSVLAAQDEKLERHYRLQNKGYDFQTVMRY